MQQVHAKDDLLQRSRRHGSDDDGTITRERIGTDADARGEPTEIEQVGSMAEIAGCPPQVADVPAVAAGEDCKVHGQPSNDRRKTAGAISPNANVRPVVRLWNTISAGANRCGSIL